MKNNFVFWQHVAISLISIIIIALSTKLAPQEVEHILKHGVTMSVFIAIFTTFWLFRMVGWNSIIATWWQVSCFIFGLLWCAGFFGIWLGIVSFSILIFSVVLVSKSQNLSFWKTFLFVFVEYLLLICFLSHTISHVDDFKIVGIVYVLSTIACFSVCMFVDFCVKRNGNESLFSKDFTIKKNTEVK